MTPLEEAAKLSAILKYLNLLEENHLVTPSIGKPYPDDRNEESSIMHQALLDVQRVRRVRRIKGENLIYII